jgi:hypothetical protein
MTITDLWHDLVTVSLLGTDRRDPPEPPPGPLADIVDDVVATTPSERMLAAVGACVAARRAGIVALPPADRLAPPPPDDRPLLPPAAARRWRSIVSDWPVLEDEWLLEVERRGWRLSPDVLVGLLRRHRTDGPRRARVVRVGGPVAGWLAGHQPALRGPSGRPPPAVVEDGLPGLAIPPNLVPLLAGPAEPVVTAVIGGLGDGTFGFTHRGVLVNFIARSRPDVLAPLAAALAGDDVPEHNAGLAHSLAELATSRDQMRQELDR